MPTKRTFNFTGRKRIPRNKVSINLLEKEGVPKSFDIEKLELKEKNYPRSAKVAVEVRYGRWFKYCDVGTVQNIKFDSVYSLEEFPDSANPHFRVKIVNSGDEHGKILGLARRIHPTILDTEVEGENPRNSILNVYWDSGMNERIWKLDLDGSEATLNINKKLQRFGDAVSEFPGFATLVIPEVLESVFKKLLIEEERHIDEIKESEWSEWLKFALSIQTSSPPEYKGQTLKSADRNNRERWISRLVQEFTSQNGLLEKYLEVLK